MKGIGTAGRAWLRPPENAFSSEKCKSGPETQLGSVSGSRDCSDSALLTAMLTLTLTMEMKMSVTNGLKRSIKASTVSWQQKEWRPLTTSDPGRPSQVQSLLSASIPIRLTATRQHHSFLSAPPRPDSPLLQREMKFFTTLVASQQAVILRAARPTVQPAEPPGSTTNFGPSSASQTRLSGAVGNILPFEQLSCKH